MKPSSEQLANICGIAHDSSLRGAGRSLHELIDTSGYRHLRPSLSEGLIADYLAEHPELVAQWSMYSDDKRTSGGWYFLHEADSWVVGRLGPAGNRSDELHFDSASEACARFILLELDFWMNLQRS